MPSSEIMEKFREGDLHSGKGGKIVKSKKQAKAILLSTLRSEGKIKKGKGSSGRTAKFTGKKKYKR